MSPRRAPRSLARTVLVRASPVGVAPARSVSARAVSARTVSGRAVSARTVLVRTVLARAVVALAVLAAGATAGPGAARAEGGAPAADPAPSQALRTDAPTPYPALAATVDVLGPVFGRYLARLVRALDRAVAAMLEAGAEVEGGRWLVRGSLGWQLWPLREGVRGVWLGLAVGAGAAPASGEQGAIAWDLPARLELGAAGVWHGVAVGLSAAVDRRLAGARLPDDTRFRFSVGVHVGWSGAR